jgi:small basic protein
VIVSKIIERIDMNRIFWYGFLWGCLVSATIVFLGLIIGLYLTGFFNPIHFQIFPPTGLIL